MNQDTLNKSLEFIKWADCVFIGAGAGLTAAAGINYTDKEAFAKYFPAWKKRGFTMQYELMGYQNWSLVEQWGYYTVQLDYVYFGQGKNKVYQDLRKLVGDRPYFVMTSNVDGIFAKNDFDADKIYEPQGSYGKIQCTVPCIQKVWDIRPFYNKMKAALDPQLQVLNSEEAVPKCPNCGENMFVHARIDRSFIDAEHKDELERLNQWMAKYRSKNILLLEFGAGFNTPSVIRFPMESLYQNLENSIFVRINMDNAKIQNGQKMNSLAYKGDIAHWLEEVVNHIQI